MAAPVFAYEGELLHQASIYDQTDLLKSLLQTGAQGDVNSRDPNGQTPLHTAAAHDSIQCLEELLKWGADPNALSPGSLRTPLHMAARNGYLRCLKVLVDNQADIDIKNSEQKTALQVAMEEQHLICADYLKTVKDIKRAAREEQDRQELLNSCVTGNTARVEQLIGQVNQSTIRQIHQGGSTMLYKASRGGHFEIVKLLLEHGADDTPNAFTGVTPLYAACFEGHVEVARLLARKIPLSISKPCQNDRSTPLHVASDKGLEAVVKILLQVPRCFS